MMRLKRVTWLIAAVSVAALLAQTAMAQPVQNADTGASFATIQAAIDDAATLNGHTIVVDVGTYAENVILNKSLTLSGAQAGVDACGRVSGTPDDSVETVIAPASGRIIELRAGSAGSVIDGFALVGGTTGIESTSGPINNVQILNNHISGTSGSAIFLNDSGTDITVHGNALDGSSAGGGGLFHLDSDTFHGFHFTDNCVENGATGFFVDGNRNVGTSGARSSLFSGNLFKANVTGANFGKRSLDGAEVSGNSFESNEFDGLQGGPKDTLITENIFLNNGRFGIALTSFGDTDPAKGAQGCTLSCNLIKDNGFVHAGGGVFFSSGQDPGTISTNVLENNDIVGNNAGATYGGTETIDAENNWWGDAAGPGGAGPGAGDTISSADIDADPWLTSPSACVPPTPTLALVVDDTCLAANETTLTVNINMTDPGDFVVGGQFFLAYDDSVLQFGSADAGDAPFAEFYEDTSTPGEIDYAVNAPEGDPGVNTDATLAVLTFNVIGEACDASDLVAFRTHEPPTRLSKEGGDPIHPVLAAIEDITLDSTPPVVFVPADVTVECDESTDPADTGLPTFDQGFETDRDGWFDFGGTLARVPSGTNGVTSASGSWHAETDGSFTRWGGYRSTFPAGGYTTSVQIYLDVDAGLANDARMDFSSAINNPSGSHRRDFIFHAGFYDSDDVTGPGAGTDRFIFNASNNAPGWPKNPDGSPTSSSVTGWYTVEHVFYDAGGGVLAVDIDVYDPTNTLVYARTLSDPTDIIGSTVGGNRYGWFLNMGWMLPIDNTSITTGDARALDNCDPAPLVTYSDVDTPGACPQEKVITRTWTATDACGNSTSVDQIITVVDTTAPVIHFVPDDVQVFADAGGCDAEVDVIVSETQTFDSNPVLSPTQAPGTWYTDRYAPAGFVSESFDGDNRLKHSIDASDCSPCRGGSFNSGFYDTQGRKYDTPNATRMTVDLYVPSDWATTGRRMAGFWATAFDASDAISLFPIIEFTSADSNPRFRRWPADPNTGDWVDMGLPTGFVYDEWYTLEVELVGDSVTYTVGDLTATVAANGSVQFGNVILQGHNTTAGVTYDIYWDNFTHEASPFATDNCGDVTITSERSDNPSLTLADPFPVGTTTITWTATDECGNQSMDSTDVTVDGDSEMVVSIELEDVNEPTLTRCITFELWDCDAASPTPTIVTNELTFTSGVANDVIEVPCGNFTCITARDELHTLRRTLDPLAISGTQYVADFVSAGKPLIGGNLNDDFWVDILDFGVFTGQFGMNYGPGDSTCATAFPHADISGNGIVGTEDFTFIQTNFLEGHEVNCCAPGPSPTLLAQSSPREDANGDGVVNVIDLSHVKARLGQPATGDNASADVNGDGGINIVDLSAVKAYVIGQGRPPAPQDGPVERISTSDLAERGLDDLIPADLNGDGWLDQQDIAAWLNGARP